MAKFFKIWHKCTTAITIGINVPLLLPLQFLLWRNEAVSRR